MVPAVGDVLIIVDLELSSLGARPVLPGISGGRVDGGGGKTLGIIGGIRGVLVAPLSPAYIPPLS